MSRQIVVLGGDGIGPEVTAAAVTVLRSVDRRFHLDLQFAEHAFGGAAIDAHQEPLPATTLAACQQADAILLGAVGGPKWANVPVAIRPEAGLLALRQALGLYANVRPLKVHEALLDASPLKRERIEGTDLVVVRELTGGIYFGRKAREGGAAIDECRYTVAEIERVTRQAARLARTRRSRLCSVDKANVLETSRLWRETVTRIMAAEFPDVAIEHLLVDAMAMYLVSRPRDFDVIVTENLFGDVLTDEAAAIAGSLGVMPSSSSGDHGPALYEPIHGSAPDIAGQGVANPMGTILSAAMMLRHSFAQEEAADAIEGAVAKAIAEGFLTRDLGGRCSTAEVTAKVVSLLEAHVKAAA
ncbi:3-isopropylmalate dehydrogenase [Ahniella affigens]|uniref:3-isopropylmalate dehydrogenase n=1 Tax=Ahniella affigens TaxID=2021234 RepID=A0A2P1PPY8_9GAMM|nr:3-isopropylmalate dehydrogenase [Ahniella affigens]AVP96906.1 3-isopropylmalate dehydrogenase [Ahniella affigens]